jgi:hypothetical protein
MSQTEYELQNFNALNNAINDEHQKSLNKIKLQKSHTFKRYMIYSSLFMFALALLILVAGFIYWLIEDKPKNLITNNEYITNNYELEKNISQLEKIIERNKEFDRSNTEIIKNSNFTEANNQVIQEDYYLFRSLDMNLSSGDEITVYTGLVYDPENIDFPFRQYCYTISNKVWIDLANKESTANKINLSYDNDNIGIISLNDFIKAQNFCRFKNF